MGEGYQCDRRNGFTLIELSIVLVIIGLIVGGVLAGQSLINAAGVRATISQIESYNSAANTFYGKYGYLPGDIPANPASQFGFAARGAYAGEGDGNGLIEGVLSNSPGNNAGYADGAGETVMFWSDLTYANGMNLNLIPGTFTTATSATPVTVVANQVGSYLPPARLGAGNFIYVFSNNVNTNVNLPSPIANFFGLSVVTGFSGAGLSSSVGLTVQQAYDIDRKIDDGIANSGRVKAVYVDIGYSGVSNTNPINSTSCYDTSSGAYAVSANSNLVNCALSIRMQAGD